jgi:hypothetical protein
MRPGGDENGTRLGVMSDCADMIVTTGAPPLATDIYERMVERRARVVAKIMQATTEWMRKKMTNETDLGGSFTPRGTSMTLRRMGYGAMQLAGPEVWGPPADVNAAVALLQEAVASSVNHIDTSPTITGPRDLQPGLKGRFPLTARSRQQGARRRRISAFGYTPAIGLAPVLRQGVNTQNPSNGELSHGIVS